MAHYSLKVVTKDGEKVVRLSHNNTVKLVAQENATYQIFDEKGNLVTEPKIAKLGEQDLAVYLEADQAPQLILEEFYRYSPIENAQQLSEMSASLATSSKDIAVATEVAMTVGQKVALLGAGAFTVLGGWLGLRSSDNKNDSAPQKKETVTPIVKQDPIDEQPAPSREPQSNNDSSEPETVLPDPVVDNKNQEPQSEETLTPPAKPVPIDEQPVPTPESQPTNNEPKTVLVDPIISLSNVAEDNVVNLAESQAEQLLKGQVTNVAGSNAKAGDTVKITIGDTELTTQLKDDLSFEVKASGALLAKNSKVVASLETADDAGNRLTTEAEKVYSVDTELAAPTIILESVTHDDIINLAESQAEQLLKGQVTNVAGSNAKAGDTVKITIGDTELTTQLKDDLSFEVKASGALLAKNSKVVVELTTTDSAGNTLITPFEETYAVDVDIAKPTLLIAPIAKDNIINAVEKREETILITGQAVNDLVHAEAKEGDTVTLTIGQAEMKGKLDSELKFAIPVSTIALVNHKTVTASLVTQDQAQNSITAQTSGTVSIDDSFKVSVSVSDITIDNTVNKLESEGQVTLSGSYTADSDVNAETVVVTLLINNQEKVAVVDPKTQTWQLVVSGADLVLEQGENRLVAKITAQDPAGNNAESSSPHIYQVDTVLNKPVVKITSIAEDDVIDSTEANGKIKITGIVENAEGNKPVVLLCPCTSCASGWKEVEAQVVDGKFEVEVLVSETSLANAKLKSAERKVKANYTAEDDAGNTAAADEASRSYSLENSNREINITKIGDNFGLDMSGSTRVTGSIQQFAVVNAPMDNDLYNQGKNARFIRMVKLVVGDKTYQAGFDSETKTFSVDIPNTDWATIAGQNVRIDFADTLNNGQSYYSKVTSPYFENNRTYLTPNRIPTAKAFTLEGDMLVKNGDNSYSIKPFVTAQTEISGVVKGDVAVGAEIEVKIGNHIVPTTVKADKTFSVLVDSTHLQNNLSGIVTATVKNTGSEVVSDSEIYVQPKAVSAEFVSQHSEVPVASRKIDHTKEDYNFFYPIHLLDGGERKFGFLNDVNIGGSETPLTVKYHFLKASEISQLPRTTEGYVEGQSKAIEENSIQEMSESLKTTFRYAYNQIAKYTNIKFEEVGSWQEVDGSKGTLLFVGNLAGQYKGASAIGYPGGNLVWDPNVLGTAGTDDYSHYMAIHEILHTLNMRHAHDSFSGVKENPAEATASNHIAEASSEFSNMSYWSIRLFDAMRDLRMYDMAYLHYRFGVNREHRSGDDVYTFKQYDSRKADGDIYIWDGNGVDTFDASMEKEGVTVNLTPGSWNYVGTERKFNFVTDTRTVYNKNTFFDKPESVVIQGSPLNNSQNEINGNPVVNPPASGVLEFQNYHDGQSFIGYGTQIENLIGSKFADTLTGNKAANNIFGGDGNDTIAGDAGDDFINGGRGDDLMFGGIGDDVYVVDSDGDVVTENAGEGIDHVYSLVNYTASTPLDENVENLTLIGTTANQAVGNAENNTIRGNDIGNTLSGLAGDDTLIGGLGADTLIGGAGRDTFVFDSSLNGKVDTITDFVVGEDKIKLDAKIFTALKSDLSNLTDHIFYDKASGELSYNSENSGMDNATAFAIVSGLQQVENNQFIVG